MKKDPNPKKKLFSLKKEFNETFRHLSWKDAVEIGKDTLKDLREPKEIFTLTAAVVVPGGLIAYPVYRIRKYRKKKNKPANDNPPPAV